MNDSGNLCPCSSGSSYESCCKRFHEGGDFPENALQLMRSRYAAYALGEVEYIIETTHPANPQYSEDKALWKRSISQFSHRSTFDRLEILDFTEQNATATVTFIAHITQKNGDATFTEKSYFEKVGNQWLYHSGQMS